MPALAREQVDTSHHVLFFLAGAYLDASNVRILGQEAMAPEVGLERILIDIKVPTKSRRGWRFKGTPVL